MAIYNNREVSLQAGIRLEKKFPETILVTTKDGVTMSVKIGDVRFTPEEKKTIIESSPLSDLKDASPEDINAVRLGIAPPSDDPDLKKKAEDIVAQEATQKLIAEHLEKAKADAKAKLDKTVVPAKPVFSPKAN